MLSIFLDVGEVKEIFLSNESVYSGHCYLTEHDFRQWVAYSVNNYDMMSVDFFTDVRSKDYALNAGLFDGYKDLYQVILQAISHESISGREISRCDGSIRGNNLILDMEFIDE